MIKVKKEELNEIADLFKGIQDSMVIACIQGYMGDAYVDRLPDPTTGLIISGEYSFFAGDAKGPQAFQLVDKLFILNPSTETVCIFPDNEPEWGNALMKVEKNNPKVVPRYGIVQKDYVFDEDLLKSYMNRVPEGYELRMFDENIYTQSLEEDWSKAFCEIYASASDYLNRGFGYAVLQDGKLVSGTSTMTVYDGGTEIQVATHPDFRKKGLAMTCAAAFVLECQHRGIRACWDADNQISKKMALALGYEYKGEYDTVHMHVEQGGNQ